MGAGLDIDRFVDCGDGEGVLVDRVGVGVVVDGTGEGIGGNVVTLGLFVVSCLLVEAGGESELTEHSPGPMIDKQRAVVGEGLE